MDLPNEIILHILKSLEKCDLKSARLVSKTWTAFAAELLFDQAYVSVHPDNFEVFEAITQHPLLSKCVKTLRYDAVDFVEKYTKHEYTHHLWLQTVTWVNSTVTDDAKFRRKCKYDKFVQRKCEDYRFINQGYRKYQRYAALQRAQFSNGNFVETLVGGLQKLKNLSCVIVNGQWPSPQRVLDDPKKLFLKRLTGSPLARNWNFFHTSPQSWIWIPEDYGFQGYGLNRDCGVTDGADHYWAITCALIRSERKIQTFEVGQEFFQGVPAYIFDRSQVKSPSFHGLDIVAFSGLRKLKLCIAAYGHEKTSEIFPNMDGLRFLLGSMHDLKVLHLSLPAESEDKPALYTYDQLFPTEGQWSQLTALSLYAFASSAADFLTLLTRRMPNLSQYQIGLVELLTGSWEGVIECMMQSLHLQGFDIIPHTELSHRGGIDFFIEYLLDPFEIEEYVEDGGRHPCLQPDQPASAAQNFVTEDLECFCKAVSSAPKAYA